MDRSRLEAFSDGVFAVAITLLAFDFTIHRTGYLSLAHQLTHDLWPSFLAYLVSFFMIGIIWVNHHVLIRQIAVVDRTLLFLNLVLLLFVVLIPFATSTVATYRLAGADARVSVVFYAAMFLGMSAGFGAIFEWTLHGNRREQPLPAAAHWPARIRFIGGAVVYLLSIGVALLSAVAGFAVLALVAIYYVFERTPQTPAPAQDETAGTAGNTTAE